MNKPKLSATATVRVLLNVFVVIALVVLASLIGVGGAALWIYGRADTAQAATKQAVPRLKTDLAASEARNFPRLTPVQSDLDNPSQLTPARYMPTDTEIATVSDTPRYTYVSYNGGRQQAHLRVNTVLTESAPATLATSTDDFAPAQAGNDRPPLNDSASRYITDAKGRVIGIDGSASAAAETRAQQVTVARALPVTPVNVTREVRVAAPVVTRKALPVDEETALVATASFDVQTELDRQDDRPVLRAQPVDRMARTTRSTMFGASDNLQAFGRN